MVPQDSKSDLPLVGVYGVVESNVAQHRSSRAAGRPVLLQLSNLLQQSQHRSFSYIWDKREKNPPSWFSEL